MNKKYFKGTQWLVKADNSVGVLVGVATPRNPASKNHGTHKVIRLYSLKDKVVRSFLKHEIKHISDPDEQSKLMADVIILEGRLVEILSSERVYHLESLKRDMTTCNIAIIGKGEYRTVTYHEANTISAKFCAKEAGRIAGTIFALKEFLAGVNS